MKPLEDTLIRVLLEKGRVEIRGFGRFEINDRYVQAPSGKRARRPTFHIEVKLKGSLERRAKESPTDVECPEITDHVPESGDETLSEWLAPVIAAFRTGQTPISWGALGSFEIAKVRARKSEPAEDGSRITIPAHRLCMFSPSEAFMSCLNQD